MSGGTNIHFSENGFSETAAAGSRLYIYQNGLQGQVAVLGSKGNLQLLQEWDEGTGQEFVRKLLGWPFARYQVLMPHQALQFIPNDLYDEDQWPQYQSLLTDNRDEPLFVYHFKHIPAKYLYTVKEPLSLSGRPLVAEEILPAAAPWIESMALMSAHEAGLLGIQIRGDCTDFVYFRDGQLIFYNRFPNADADEFNYFLLCVLQEGQTDLNDTLIVVAGDIRREDGYYRRISKYSKNIQFAPLSGLLHTDVETIWTESHRLLNLFSTVLCE